MKPLLIITGPTASGKSKLATELAKRLGTEIISADSMQIYRGMDIGTAKPSKAEQREVRHHLIDIVEPDEPFSSFLFKRETERVLEDFERRGLVPLIAGGTGFYLKNLLYRFDFEQAGGGETRKKLSALGKDALYAELSSVDPKSAEKLHPNDTKRVMRALEIFFECGLRKSEGKNDQNPVYPHKIFVLDCERRALYDRINERVEQMMRQGLLNEVKNLLKKGVPRGAQSMQAIGYKELAAHLSGECTLETAVELIKQHTRNYAKRQVTYFKKLADAEWVSTTENDNPLDTMIKIVSEKYEYC